MNRNRLLIVIGCAGLGVVCLCLLIGGGWFVRQGMSGEGPLAMLATATKTQRPTRTPEPTYTQTPTPSATNTPSPTFTPTSTNTPTRIPTDTPIPTPPIDVDRSEYRVTLRATLPEVLERFEEVKDILEAVGYEVVIGTANSVWGSIDYVAYGTLIVRCY
ncbi:MAG: hypothetical protein FVQ83_14545 [Chloroflexi bacterium]|nr:hypothetical protein [Chloroflexota bacterium]